MDDAHRLRLRMGHAELDRGAILRRHERMPAAHVAEQQDNSGL